MATINLYIRPEMKDAKGLVPVYLVFQDKGKKFKNFTGIKIPSMYWDANAQEIYNEFPEAESYNSILKEKSERLWEVYRKMIETEVGVDLDLIKKAFNNPMDHAPLQSAFFIQFDVYLEESQQTKKRSTFLVYQALKKDLKNFENQSGYELKFSAINDQFYDQFNPFLTEVLNNNNNTVSKKIKALKAFLNFCAGKKLIDPTLYKSFKTDVTAPFRLILSEAELAKIFNLNLALHPELEEVRDLFLFGCFTGMKYSDIQLLTHKDIASGKIDVQNYFTNEILSIPLNNYAQRILRKYEDRNRSNCFPKVPNVYANKFVKEIAKLSELNQLIEIEIFKGKEVIKKSKPKYDLITMDSARFTFAALSLQSGMRPEVLILILGQKNINSLMKYVMTNNPVQDMEILNCWNKKVL